MDTMKKMTLIAALLLAATTATFAQQAPGPYERELDGMIYDAIGRQDWDKAQDLAVTPRQKQMVMVARERERDRRAQA